MEFVGSGSLEEETEVLANKIKAELALDKSWNIGKTDVFKYLRRKISDAGIMVMQSGIVGGSTSRTLDINEFRAFVMIDEYVPLIFINATDSPRAKIFSLCHELVHIWLGIDELYNDIFTANRTFNNEKLEIFCNEVAAEILLPKQLLKNIYDKQEDVNVNINNISKRYSVSKLVTCIRMKNVNLINKKTFDSVYANLLENIEENFSKEKQNDQSNSGGNFYNLLGSRLDPRFVHSVNRKAREGSILYTEAYELVGAKGKTYDKLMDHMEGRCN